MEGEGEGEGGRGGRKDRDSFHTSAIMFKYEDILTS